MDLSVFEEKIDYTFINKQYLKTALTHTSYANEQNVESNEKLEFLGDAILEFVTSNYLYKAYAHLKEGEMTKVRASVVCESYLYKVAMRLNFSDFLYLGKSERVNNGKTRPAMLADSVEAVIAAMYLDGGIEVATNFIVTNLKEGMEVASKSVGMKDYKTVLQEKLQSYKNPHIKYEIIQESGPDHNKLFTAQVKFNGKILATGTGKSKKIAEMDAAHNAILNNKL